MSLNIHIWRHNDKSSTEFPARQTRTVDTERILASADPLTAYRQWVLDDTAECVRDETDEGWIAHLREEADAHLKALEVFVEEAKLLGQKVDVGFI